MRRLLLAAVIVAAAVAWFIPRPDAADPEVVAAREAVTAAQARSLDAFAALTPHAKPLGESVRDACRRVHVTGLTCERRATRHLVMDGSWADLKDEWQARFSGAGWVCIPPPMIQAAGRTGCRNQGDRASDSVAVTWLDRSYPTPGTTPPPADEVVVTDQRFDPGAWRDSHQFLVTLSITSHYYGPEPDAD